MMLTESGKAELQEEYDSDGGVSLAMSKEFNWEKRIPLLMIHGMLHLLGYDHEKSKDWKQMTHREDEVIKEFNKRYVRE